jgi:REP element-mobilizing transposase RayT
MPRQARLDVPGVFQNVMARGIEKRRIFSDHEDYTFFIDRLGELLVETHTKCFAWVLMPNHFHLLLRTTSIPLATFMRRLMTSFAVHYNRRYERSGHLFQNRYKSFVCEEDPYFLELIRYIHLNPLRSGLVRDLDDLERYPWSGYGVLMGRRQNSWQEIDEVLGYFNHRIGKAREAYRRFMEGGLNQGRRPELMGGLHHSVGEGEIIFQEQDQDSQNLHDPRILGSSDFVKDLLKESKYHRETTHLRLTLKDIAEKVVNWSNLSGTELTSGSKRPEVAKARAVLSYIAVRLAKMRTTEVALFLNVSQSAISKSILKGEKFLKENQPINQILK